MGGMPMTISTQLSDQKCQNNFSEGGWRNCPTESDAVSRVGFTSQAWKDHNTQIAYYTVSTVRFPSVSNNILSIGFKGSCVNDDKPKNENATNRNCTSINRNTLSELINLNKGTVKTDASNNEKYNFYSRVLVPKVGNNQISLNKIKRGDYVWINSGGVNNHGLLVVGWALMKDCRDAILTPFNFNNLFPESPQKTLTNNDLKPGTPVSNLIYVPFVVDYSYGVTSNVPPLQSTVPRPFYCTQFDESALNAGRSKFSGAHSWTFLNFPNAVEIPTQSLYVDPTWQWTAATR
jgi:hypothetical protein